MRCCSHLFEISDLTSGDRNTPILYGVKDLTEARIQT